MAASVRNSIHKLRDKISKRPYVKKVLSNIGWLSADKAFQILISFIVIVWMIRYLGPEEYGILSYAWAITGIFGAFASLGLYNVLVRDLVKFPQKKGVFLGTSMMLVFISGIIALFASIITVYLISPSNILLLIVVGISAVQFAFLPLNLFSAWFDSKVSAKYSVLSRNIMLTVVSVLKVIFIIAGVGVIYFAFASLCETIILVGGLVYFFNKKEGGFVGFKFDFSVAKKLLKEAFPLILSGVAAAIYLRIDQVLIGQMISLSEVGIYAVAVKIVEFGSFIPSVVIGSVAPVLILSKKNSAKYNALFGKLYDFLIVLSLCMSIILTVFSSQIITILYGPEFSAGIGVLAVYSWSLIPWVLTLALGQYFVIEKKTNFAFYTAVIGAIANVVFNLLFIPILGMIGAALATVASYSLVVASLFFFKQTREHAFLLVKSLNIVRVIRSIISKVAK